VADRETVSGPYQKWLLNARRRVGERVWEHLQDIWCMDADDILRSMGVTPFQESEELWLWIEAYGDPRRGVDVKTEGWEAAKGYSQGPKPILRAPDKHSRTADRDE
jgi:hypothetical protein